MARAITPHQTLDAARAAGATENDLRLAGAAILTFSRAIAEHLEDVCEMADADWIGSNVHPYAAPQLVKRGRWNGLDIVLLVPPMGASPLACTIEDLATCGVGAVFLACAAWSLGPPVRFGDLVVPSFAAGPDGTSVHYGNADQHVDADARVVAALADATRGRSAVVHVGGNASCEALYRITPEMMDAMHARGCLSMENGEAAVLFAAGHALDLPTGAIFQPYIDLTERWNPNRLDETYQAMCRVQAEVVLDAAVRLRDDGVLRDSTERT